MTTSTVPGGVTIEQYNQCVVYYFDTQMNSDIMGLSKEDKVQFFQMFTDHSVIMEKIFHSGIPLVNYIVFGDEFHDGKVNPHAGIDETPSQMVIEYKAWALENNLPIPEIVPIPVAA